MSIIGTVLIAILEPRESISYCETKKESASEENPCGAVLSANEKCKTAAESKTEARNGAYDKRLEKGQKEEEEEKEEEKEKEKQEKKRKDRK